MIHLLRKPPAGAHPGAVAEGFENVRVDLLAGPVLEPPLGLVQSRAGKQRGVEEVDAGVQVNVSTRAYVVASQYRVLKVLPFYLQTTNHVKTHLTKALM